MTLIRCGFDCNLTVCKLISSAFRCIDCIVQHRELFVEWMDHIHSSICILLNGKWIAWVRPPAGDRLPHIKFTSENEMPALCVLTARKRALACLRACVCVWVSTITLWFDAHFAISAFGTRRGVRQFSLTHSQPSFSECIRVHSALLLFTHTQFYRMPVYNMRPSHQMNVKYRIVLCEFQ